jgi:hypothetical protein
MGFPASGRTITSSTLRRIRTGIARITRAECRLILRSYARGRRRSLRSDPGFCRETEVYEQSDSRPCGFLQGNAVYFLPSGLPEVEGEGNGD